MEQLSNIHSLSVKLVAMETHHQQSEALTGTSNKFAFCKKAFVSEWQAWDGHNHRLTWINIYPGMEK